MLTPFNHRNEIDREGLRKLTHLYLAAGAAGLFANCLSSEMYQLNETERLAIVQTVVATAPDSIPVLAAGTFGQDPAYNADFIKRLHDAGAQAVVLNTNQLTPAWASEADFKTKVEELLQRTGDIPLGLYECPVPHKRLLSPDLLKWLGQTERFRYLKDTCCNRDEIQQKIKAVEGTPLGIYDAHTPNAITSLQAGARGLSPIGANFYPELYEFLWLNHDSTEDMAIFEATLSLLDSVIHENYPWSAKYFLQQRGLPITTHTRKPQPHITRQSILKLEAVQTIFDKLCLDFGIQKVRFA